MTHVTNLRTITSNVVKKAAVTLALLMTLTATFAFSNARPVPTDDANSEIRASFKKDFQHAQIMSTEVHKAFTRVNFKMDDLVMSAYYTGDGELLAVTHNIVSTRLPLNLLMSLKKEYSSYWITELFEFTGNNDTCYYVSLEDADSRVTLRSNVNGWEVYSTVKK